MEAPPEVFFPGPGGSVELLSLPSHVQVRLCSQPLTERFQSKLPSLHRPWGWGSRKIPFPWVFLCHPSARRFFVWWFFLCITLVRKFLRFLCLRIFSMANNLLVWIRGIHKIRSLINCLNAMLRNQNTEMCMLWCESPCLGALRVGVGVGGVFCGWDVKSWWMDFSIFFKLGFAGVQTLFSIFLRLIPHLMSFVKWWWVCGWCLTQCIYWDGHRDWCTRRLCIDGGSVIFFGLLWDSLLFIMMSFLFALLWFFCHKPASQFLRQSSLMCNIPNFMQITKRRSHGQMAGNILVFSKPKI